MSAMIAPFKPTPNPTPVSLPNQSSYTNLARSSTFPKHTASARRRLTLVESHLSSLSARFQNRRSTQDRAPDVTVAVQIAPGTNMSSKREAEPKEARECLMCKRKFEDEEEKPSKIARKDGAVDIDAPVVDRLHQLPPIPDPLPEENPKFKHCMPPEKLDLENKKSIFLAGSIEMGKAVQWQRQMALTLRDLPITVCNPRRGAWDPNVTKSAKDAAFKEQVEWELAALEGVSIIIFFFDANTVSPVTMMELGLWAHSGKVIVCCDPRFWRAGNVHLVCERYKVPYVEKFDDLVAKVRARLEEGPKLDSKASLAEADVEANE